MRKMQEKILDKALKIDICPVGIELLSREDITIKHLQSIFYFFSIHKNDTIKSMEEYFEVENFLRQIQSSSDKYILWYDLFSEFSIKEIVDIKVKCNNDIIQMDRMLSISLIANTMRKHCSDNFSVENAVGFYNARKEFLIRQNIVTERLDFPNMRYPIWEIYSKFPNIPLYEKFNIEKEVEKRIKLQGVKIETITAYESFVYDYFKELAYKSYKLKDLFEDKDGTIRSHLDLLPDADRCNFLLNSFCDNPSFWGYEKIEDRFIQIGGSQIYTKYIMEIIGSTTDNDKLPLSIHRNISSTGISFNIKQMSKYSLGVYDGKPEIRGSEVVYEKDILFTFDNHCFIKRNGKWIPMLLNDFSKLYHQNKTIKEIMICYINCVIASGGYVWKDFLKMLERNENMLPIKVNDTIFYKSKQELMTSLYKKSDFTNWNKGSMYIKYIAMKSIPRLCKQDMPILIDFINRFSFDITLPDVSYKHNISIFFEKILEKRFFENDQYWEKKWDEKYPGIEFGQIFCDYMNMMMQMHKKVSIRFKSPFKIKEQHDEIMLTLKEKNVPVIKIPKKSVFLNLSKILPEDFEWIKSRRRLVMEGIDMHHCVASYGGSINNDRCAIYSLIYNNERYTIEFGFDRNRNIYIIRQIQGVCNSGCCEEVRNYVNKYVTQ